MTDGTSQGLFIVVAIVIFGIFVVLAYILFEDTLSPAMASMFTDAIEKSSESVQTYTDARFFAFDRDTRTITGFRPDIVTDYPEYLHIPPRIGGIPVERIGNSAFTNKEFKEVRIPNTVITIEKRAFNNSKIYSLDLGKSVQTIEASAFHVNSAESWDGLTEITLPDSLKTINQSAFDNRLLVKLTGGNNVTFIGVAAFQNSTFTGTLTLPSVEQILNGAFRESQLDKLVIPVHASIDPSWTDYATIIERK